MLSGFKLIFTLDKRRRLAKRAGNLYQFIPNDPQQKKMQSNANDFLLAPNSRSNMLKIYNGASI